MQVRTFLGVTEVCGEGEQRLEEAWTEGQGAVQGGGREGRNPVVREAVLEGAGERAGGEGEEEREVVEGVVEPENEGEEQEESHGTGDEEDEVKDDVVAATEFSMLLTSGVPAAHLTTRTTVLVVLCIFTF